MPNNKHDEWVNKMKLGLEMTYANLIKFKKMKKSPLIISKEGKIVEISAEDLPPRIKID